MKLAFAVIEVGLAIGNTPVHFIHSWLICPLAFGVLNKTKKWNEAAIVEWVIALCYTLWVISFVVDFLPAARVHDHQNKGDLDSTRDEEAMTENGYGHH